MNSVTIKLMNVAILGFAGQGKSSYDYWSQPSNTITICDSNPATQTPNGTATQLGPDYLQNLDQFDLLVRTPILHPRDIIAANPQSPGILDKVTTNTNEFMRVCPTKNIIAVTGTKGKGTTSTLITRMLQAAGKTVHLGGNIGLAPLDMLKGLGGPTGSKQIEPSDYVVLEIANFQLIDLRHSPHIAVCLMVEPEHLDWHEDLEEYVAAKQQLFINQLSDDLAIYYADNKQSISIADASVGTQLPYMRPPGAWVKNDHIVIGDTTLCAVDELKLLGKHNWQNACAAVTAVWQVAPDVAAITSILKSFAGLPYRLELHSEVANVRYYNDSFATGPGSSIAAINSIAEPKVMIIGGYDRGLNLSGIANSLADNKSSIRQVILIGQSSQRMHAALSGVGFDKITVCTEKTMNKIVDLAASLAQPGDAVVLSPGFASFDMFVNFEDRGIKFNLAVNQL